LDAVLGGGLPRGRVSELCGPLSSGKTSLALSLLAAATQRGEVVAYVDPADALHPESVGQAGVVLGRLLWVLPRSMLEALRCTELLLRASGFAVIAFDLGMRPPRSHSGHVWPRLARAAERSHTALVIVAPERVAGSFAALSLVFTRKQTGWSRGPVRLFEELITDARVVRHKLGGGSFGGTAVALSGQLSAVSFEPGEYEHEGLQRAEGLGKEPPVNAGGLPSYERVSQG